MNGDRRPVRDVPGPRTFVIHGERISGIAALYDELNRVFMSDEDWRLGESLDALDDLLYGGFGSAAGTDPIVVIWTGSAHTASALGVSATRAYYEEKLRHPDQFNADAAQRKLDALDAGTGQTYFEIVQQIFAEHPRYTVDYR